MQWNDNVLNEIATRNQYIVYIVSIRIHTLHSNEWLNSIRNEKNDKIKDLNVSDSKWINLLAAHPKLYVLFYEQYSNVQFTSDVYSVHSELGGITEW